MHFSRDGERTQGMVPSSTGVMRQRFLRVVRHSFHHDDISRSVYARKWVCAGGVFSGPFQ